MYYNLILVAIQFIINLKTYLSWIYLMINSKILVYI